MQGLQVLTSELSLNHLIHDLADVQSLLVSGEPQPGVEALFHCLVTAIA